VNASVTSGDVATRTIVSDEEIQLRKRARRRLVGAIALVLLVVAAVPMVLDGEPKPHAEQIEVHLDPTPASGAGGSAPPAVAAAPRQVDAPAATPDAAPPAQDEGVQPVSPPLAAQPQPVTPPPAAAPASDAKPPAADGYVVQLIATVSAAKARDLRQKLERQKFPVYTEKTPDGGKIRVRVGPYDTRESAEQARQRLAKLDYDPGKVVRKGN
jgi:DedD protein